MTPCSERSVLPVANGGFQRLTALDLLRVLGVAVVIGLLHSQSYVLGTAEVAIEFSRGWYYLVSSLALGFVTAVSAHALVVSRQTRGREPLVRYFRRRVLRLWPLYVVALVLFLRLWYENRAIEWYVAQFLCAGPLFSGLIGDPVATLWYVQMQVVYSALAGTILAVRGARIRVAVTVLVLVLGIVWCLVLGIGSDLILLYAPSYLVGYAVGIRPPSSTVSVLLFLSSAVAAVTVLEFANSGNPALVLAIRSTVPALAYPLVVSVAKRVGDVLSGRVLSLVAYGSFGAYLFHRPVLSLMKSQVKPQEFIPALLLFSVVGTILSFVVGAMIQLVYDRSLTFIEARRRAWAERN